MLQKIPFCGIWPRDGVCTNEIKGRRSRVLATVARVIHNSSAHVASRDTFQFGAAQLHVILLEALRASAHVLEYDCFACMSHASSIDHLSYSSL